MIVRLDVTEIYSNIKSLIRLKTKNIFQIFLSKDSIFNQHFLLCFIHRSYDSNISHCIKLAIYIIF